MAKPWSREPMRNQLSFPSIYSNPWLYLICSKLHVACVRGPSSITNVNNSKTMTRPAHEIWKALVRWSGWVTTAERMNHGPRIHEQKNSNFLNGLTRCEKQTKIWTHTNLRKRLVPIRLRELHESKFSFVLRIEFIRSKLSNFSARVSGVAIRCRYAVRW